METKPKCEYFGKCGGCRSQHVPYEIQLQNKQKQLASLLSIDPQEITVFSDQPYNYRNRMDFVIQKNGLSFRKKGKWDQTVNIKHCEISMPIINQLLEEINKYFIPFDEFHLHKQTGTFKYAVIRTSRLKDTSVTFTLNEDSSKLKEAIEKVKEYAKISSAKNIIIAYVKKQQDLSTSENIFITKGSEYLEEELANNKYFYSSQGFFQNNPIMAEKMIKYVQKLLDLTDTKDSQLLDLYGGVGTFGISLANQFHQTFIVESFGPSIQIAKKNIQINNINNCSAHTLQAKQIKYKLNLDKDKPLITIVDPPRSGMTPKALRNLLELEPKKIVYISCNPKQLSKELKKFKNRGYIHKNTAMFDLFPQTNHMEAIVELVREKEEELQ